MLKRCPRCGGNFLVDYDLGWVESCLQCSYSRPLSPTDPRYPDKNKKLYELHGPPGTTTPLQASLPQPLLPRVVARITYKLGYK